MEYTGSEELLHEESLVPDGIDISLWPGSPSLGRVLEYQLVRSSRTTGIGCCSEKTSHKQPCCRPVASKANSICGHQLDKVRTCHSDVFSESTVPEL
eukprot:3893968-Amphidinium_carterae.1